MTRTPVPPVAPKRTPVPPLPEEAAHPPSQPDALPTERTGPISTPRSHRHRAWERIRRGRLTAPTMFARALNPDLTDADLERSGDMSLALRDWRRHAIEDLGGEDAVTATQIAAIDDCLHALLILWRIKIEEATLMSTDALFDKKGRLCSITKHREDLSMSLQRKLKMLGLRGAEDSRLPSDPFEDWRRKQKAKPPERNYDGPIEEPSDAS